MVDIQIQMWIRNECLSGMQWKNNLCKACEEGYFPDENGAAHKQIIVKYPIMVNA